MFLYASVCMVATGIAMPFAQNEAGFNVLRALQGLSASAMIPSAQHSRCDLYKSSRETLLLLSMPQDHLWEL